MPQISVRTAPRRSIFISYSHADIAGVRELLLRLDPICSRLPGGQRAWVDLDLHAGQNWRHEILQGIEDASVFIVLLSPNYADRASFCMTDELRLILAKQAAGKALVIPITYRAHQLVDFAVQTDAGAELRINQVHCIPVTDRQPGGQQRRGFSFIQSWPEGGPREDCWVELALQMEAALVAHWRAQPQSDGQLASPSQVQVAGASAVQGLAKLPVVSPQTVLAAEALPYFADREDQCLALSKALIRWKATGYRRPLVVLTEGRREDCLNKWVDRLQDVELARSLGMAMQTSAPEGTGSTLGLQMSFGQYKSMAWPSSAGREAAASLAAEHFERALATALGPVPTASHDEVVTAYRKRARPSLLWVPLGDSVQTDEPCRALDGLLHLLERWPDLGLADMLVVAINLDRGAGRPAGERAQLGLPFEQRMQAAEQAGAICAAPLYSLPDVSWQHLELWGAEFKQHPHYRLRQDLGDLVEADLPQAESWPMKTFAAKAQHWIDAA